MFISRTSHKPFAIRTNSNGPDGTSCMSFIICKHTLSSSEIKDLHNTNKQSVSQIQYNNNENKQAHTTKIRKIRKRLLSCHINETCSGWDSVLATDWSTRPDHPFWMIQQADLHRATDTVPSTSQYKQQVMEIALPCLEIVMLHHTLSERWVVGATVIHG